MFGQQNKPTGSASSQQQTSWFGQQQQRVASGFFGSTTSQQNKTGSNFSTLKLQTESFGRQQAQTQPQGFSSVQSNSSACVVGQSSTIGSPDTAQTGTVIKFTPITCTDVVQKGSLTTWINTKYQCITFMKEYEDKSLEELRYEDYLANRKGPHQQTGFKATPFGTTASSVPSVFRQVVHKSAFGHTTAVGQTLSTLGQPITGFGTNTNLATSFAATLQSKAQQSQANSQGSSLIEFNSSASAIEQASTIDSPSTAQTGTVIKFTPITGTDVVQKGRLTTWINTKHHCITCMKEYEGKSLEELRYEDYLAKRKGSHKQTGFKATPFGTAASSAPPLFKPALGQTTAFGQTQSTFGQPITGFGHQNQQNTSLFGKSTTGFGTFASGASTSSFGINTNVATCFGATQQSKPQQSSTIGSPDTTQAGTLIKFTPITCTDVVQKGRLTTWINTKYQCITFMKEYESKSLEELRYEDYLANRKGPHQQTAFKATPFGTADSSAPSLFRQADNKPAFAQTTAFGQTQSTFGQPVAGFSHQNQQNTVLFGKPSTGFGTLTASNPSFGLPASNPSFGTNTNVSSSFVAAQPPKSHQSRAQPQGSSLCQSIGSASISGQSSAFASSERAESGTAIKFTPIIGIDTIQKGSVATLISTKHHCITCMKEYQGKSLEELRYEDYLAGRGNLAWKNQTGFGTTRYRKKKIAISFKQRRYSHEPSAKGSDRNCFSVPPSPLISLSGKSLLEQSVIGADFQDNKNSGASFSSRPFSANFVLDNQPKSDNSGSVVSPFGQTFSSFGLRDISSGLQSQQNVDSDFPTPISEQKQSGTGSTCHNQRNNGGNSRRALPSSYLFDKCDGKVDFVQPQPPGEDSNSNSNAQLSKDNDSDSTTTPFSEQKQSLFGISSTGSDCNNQRNNDGDSSRLLPSSYLFDDKSCKPPPSLAASLFEKCSEKTIFEQTQPFGKISTDSDLRNEQTICDSSSTPMPSTSHSLSNPEDNSVVGRTTEELKSSSEQSSPPFNTKESGEIKPSSGKSSMSFIQNERNSVNDSCTVPESSVSSLLGCTNDESLSQQAQFSSDLPVDSNPKKQESTDTSSSKSSLCHQKEDKIVSDEALGSEEIQSLIEQFLADLSLQNR